MKIEVTEEDIKAGWRNALYCPVALALDRATNQDWHVSADHLSPCIGENYDKSEIPARVRRFIRAFDQGKKVRPFSFELPEVRVEDEP